MNDDFDEWWERANMDKMCLKAPKMKSAAQAAWNYQQKKIERAIAKPHIGNSKNLIAQHVLERCQDLEKRYWWIRYVYLDTNEADLQYAIDELENISQNAQQVIEKYSEHIEEGFWGWMAEIRSIKEILVKKKECHDTPNPLFKELFGDD